MRKHTRVERMATITPSVGIKNTMAEEPFIPAWDILLNPTPNPFSCGMYGVACPMRSAGKKHRSLTTKKTTPNKTPEKKPYPKNDSIKKYTNRLRYALLPDKK